MVASFCDASIGKELTVEGSVDTDRLCDLTDTEISCFTSTACDTLLLPDGPLNCENQSPSLEFFAKSLL